MAEDRPIFSRQQVQDTLRTRDAIKDIQAFMKSMGQDTSNVRKDFSAIDKAANNFATAQEKAKANTGNVNQLLKQSNDLIGKANKLTAEVSNKEKQRQANLQKIRKIYADSEKDNKKLTESQKAQIRNLEIQNQELQSSSEALLTAADHTKVLGGNFKDLATTSVEISRNGYGIAAGISKTLKLSHFLTDSFEKASEIQRERTMILAEEADLNDRINKALADANKNREKGTKEITKQQFLEKGKGLTKERAEEFGLDAFTEGATGAQGGKRIRDAQQGMANAKTALPSQLGTLFKGLAKSIGALAKSLIILKGIGKIVEMIEYSFFGIQQESIDLARAFSMTRAEGFELRRQIDAAARSAGVLGANTEDFIKLQLEFTNQTGMRTKLNLDQLKTMSLMTKQMGLSNEEAVHLTESFKAQGVSSEQGLNSLLNSYNAMKLQGEATTTFKALMGDITKDAELQRIFLTQGADAAMRNAQAQRRTGLSLAQQRSMAEGTLDFEKTMSDQLELQLLTGKDITLQKAQELALQGRNGEAVAEIQKQMGKLTAEQRRSPIIMNKMLSILGMSREEYYEMLNTQAQQNAAREKEQKIVKALRAETNHLHEAKKKNFADEKSFRDTLTDKQKKEFDIALEKFKNDEEYIGKLNVARLDAVSEEAAQQKVLNDMINKFSDEQIQNARIRKGLVQGEVKDFTNLRSTSEAFEDTMKLLKSQFASLVNTGVVEDLTTMLVDFTQRVAEVGFFKAVMGGGDEEVRQANIDRLLSDENVSEQDKQLVATLRDTRKNQPRGRQTPQKQAEMRATVEAANEEIARLAMIYSNPEEMRKRLDAQAEAAGTNVNDFILRPGEPPIKFNKGDIVMGGTQLGMGGGKIERLLEELLAETKAGKVIKMDTVTVANSLRRNAIKMNT